MKYYVLLVGSRRSDDKSWEGDADDPESAVESAREEEEPEWLEEAHVYDDPEHNHEVYEIIF